MPYAASNGVRLYYEEAGRGNALMFVHESSGDLRTWEAQMRFFSRRYRCIAFNARGYPPSEVPRSPSKYSYRAAVDDIANMMRHLALGRAHVIGCSMGAYATLLFGMRYPRRARSLTAIGAGAGSSDPAGHRKFLATSLAAAREFEEQGLGPAMKRYRNAPNRIQLENKDPRGFRQFFVRFAEHSPIGHANTLRGVQMRRPPLCSFERSFARMTVPTHLVVGDEAESAIGAGHFLKRACPAARMTMAPASGHLVNVEEPEFFNRVTAEFLALVDGGRWRPRDRRSLSAVKSRA